VFALGDDTWGVVLGDVCGSGPEAASQTALTRHTVRTAAMFDTNAATVVHALNRALLRSETTRFTTALFLRLRLASDGRVTASLASGGHPPAVIRRADGSIEQTTATGQLLGVTDFDVEALRVADFELHSGDTVVLFTDGLTEARRAGVLFDVEGIESTLRHHSGEAPSEIANALVEAALAHAGKPLSDDVAIVVLKVL
jgi:serine phosphatase RsbU (regulator of sigma subunit)